MYEAPFTLIEQIVEQSMKAKEDFIEDAVLNACMSVGVKIDREELIKLLTNDREQYDKGYNDGIHTLADRLKMQSVLVGDELYITMEESELDGLVKELTGCE